MNFVIQTLMGENSSIQRNVSKKMLLIIGARRHLEWGHEKYVVEMIQSHPAQVKKDIFLFVIFSYRYYHYSIVDYLYANCIMFVFFLVMKTKGFFILPHMHIPNSCCHTLYRCFSCIKLRVSVLFYCRLLLVEWLEICNGSMLFLGYVVTCYFK